MLWFTRIALTITLYYISYKVFMVCILLYASLVPFIGLNLALYRKRAVGWHEACNKQDMCRAMDRILL